MKIDYDNAASGGRVYPGEYEGRVSGYQMKTSKNNNQCIQLDYEIRKDVTQECQGECVRYDNFTFTENAFWRICAAAKAAGLPDGMEIPDEYPEYFGMAMKGRYLRIVVEDKTYNDRTYPAVREFLGTATPVRQPPVPSMDSEGFMPAPEDDFMNIPDDVPDGLPFN